MRIIIDILHPAHVHFFKNFYFSMLQRGHSILVTAREKDRSIDLLSALGIPFEMISRRGYGFINSVIEYIYRTIRFYITAKKFKPDVLAGIMGPTIAVVGFFIRCPRYVFYDTEFARITNFFVYPLSTKVITPSCYKERVGKNHVTYAG
ncbi:MAG: DUF354 domain-containing protein, partial [Elusimicrobiota bacterium]